MSFLTNLREFFKRDPEDAPAEGVGDLEFGGIQRQAAEQRQAAAAARREAEEQAARVAEAQGTTTSPLPELAATDVVVFDDLTPEEQAIAQELVTLGEADNLNDAIKKSPELFPGLTGREDSEQSTDVNVSPEESDPEDPSGDDKGATQSTDSSGETVSQESNIEAGDVPLTNPLSVFSSYSSIISLFVLAKEELANPDAYRQSEPEF